MATITLDKDECAGGRLPMVCVITGLPAESELEKTFMRKPAGSYIVLLLIFVHWLGLIFYILFSFAVRKKMIVHLPVAEGYRNYWLWRKLVFAGGISFSLGLIFSGTAFIGWVWNLDVGIFVTYCGVVVCIAVLCIGSIVYFKSVRPIEITTTQICLSGVHPNFVAALQEMRAEESRSDDEVEPERRWYCGERHEPDMDAPARRKDRDWD